MPCDQKYCKMIQEISEGDDREMKALTMFYLEDCGYCAKARKALEELYAENPEYREVPLQMIEESQEARISDDMRQKYPALFGGTVHRPEFIFFRCRQQRCTEKEN